MVLEKPIDGHVHLGYSIPAEEILNQMKISDVEKAVVFALPAEVSYGADMNSYVLSEAERTGVFIPFYYMLDDLKLPENIEKFRGIKWHWVRGAPHYRSNMKLLHEPRLIDLAQRLAELKLPVIMEEDLAFTKEFVRLADEVILIIPHLGLLGGSPREFLEAFKEYENVYFDTALAAKWDIEHFYRELGADRLIFGSDIPFGYMKSELAKVLTADIPEEDVKKITRENILKLTGLR